MGKINFRPQRMLVYPQLRRLRAHRVVEVGYPAWIARFLEVVLDAPDLIVLAPHLEQMGDHLAREAVVSRVGLSPGSQRRFALVYERLALPGFSRAARYELLVALGAGGRIALVPDQLELGTEGDPATVAAKRILQSGDRMLLERRARDLAAACELPLAALDRALTLWGDPGAEIDAAEELPAAMRAALALR